MIPVNDMLSSRVAQIILACFLGLWDCAQCTIEAQAFSKRPRLTLDFLDFAAYYAKFK